MDWKTLAWQTCFRNFHKASDEPPQAIESFSTEQTWILLSILLKPALFFHRITQKGNGFLRTQTNAAVAHRAAISGGRPFVIHLDIVHWARFTA